MADKYFLLLTNSYKGVNKDAQGDTGRCMAGIELIQDSKWKFKYVDQQKNRPQWIRPVSKKTATKAIPKEEAEEFKLFDIICLKDVEHVPNGAQQENYYYSSMAKIPRDKQIIKQKWLEPFLDNYHKDVFTDESDEIANDCISSSTFNNLLNYSLMMIKVKEAIFVNKQGKIRCTFKYNEKEYQLSVTDPNFRDQYASDIEKANSFDTFFFVISVSERPILSCGLSLHYKLITTVFVYNE